MAASLLKKSGATKGNGGVSGAIVPPRKLVDNFPLMTYVSKHCSFDDVSDESSLENEEDLKLANNKRVDELLSKASMSIKNQSSSEEADRKTALEVLRSLELARNQKETWKVSEPNSNRKAFLHPLKRNEKEDEYFSGKPKIKQVKERKRCRSDEVVLLDNGKLVPKNSSLDYFESSEVAQLPLKFNMPVRSKPPRVPSVGLPFTPGPPVSTANNPWMQKSGTQLFSDVQSQTLLLNGSEDKDLALAIAESLRTAKEEQQRNAMLETLYQSQYEAVSTSSTRCDKPLTRGTAGDLSKASLQNDCWEEKATPFTRNRSMSIDSTNQVWDQEKKNSNHYSEDSDPNGNNNYHYKKSDRVAQFSEACLDQRPRHGKEEKTSKSPPPMLNDFEKSVSQEGTVITLQAPDKKKCRPQTKQSEEKEEEKRSENMMNHEHVPPKDISETNGKKSESKQDKIIPKTNHVPETFDHPKISSSRLPTSKPTALMTAMRNFTQTSIERKAAQNYVGHIARTTESSTEVPEALKPLKDSIKNPKELQEEKKNETQQLTDAEGLNFSATKSNSGVPKISSNVPLSQPQPHTPLPATSSSSISLGGLSVASAQAQYHQMLLMQQSVGGIPQVPQNGQNLGGANVQSSNKEKQPEKSQPERGSSSMASFPTDVLNTLPNRTSSPSEPVLGLSNVPPAGLLNTVPGPPNTFPIPGVSNTLPGDLSGFPNTFPGNITGFAPFGSIPGLNDFLPSGVSGITNPYPGFIPGLTVPYSGNIMPGLINPLQQSIPGLENPLQGGVPNFQTLPGSMSDAGLAGMPSFTQPAGFPGYPNGFPGVPPSTHNSMPSGFGGLQSSLPGSFQTPVSTSLPGIQNCNSFGGMAQSFTPQPGSAPLMGGRGRGRLAKPTGQSKM